MELTFEKTTHIGLGYATQTDAFQCGREAAQMAKGQVPAKTNDIVLVFSPSGIHFKDCIEGVRLVTGEDSLVGIPVDWVISNDLPSSDACLVLVLQFSSMHFTIVSSGEKSFGLDSEITSLISQMRQSRGNARSEYAYHGILLFENWNPIEKEDLAKLLAADAGLETWMIGLSPGTSDSNPLICKNHVIRNGLVGVELFSNNPCGIGTVGTGAFATNLDIYREATKSSVRDALIQLEEKQPALGLICLDLPTEIISRDELWDIFRSTSTLLPNVPLIMIPTRRQFSRTRHRSTITPKASVITLLVPH